MSKLIGANRAYVDDVLPHIGELLIDDVESILEHAEVFAAGSTDEAVLNAMDRLRTTDVLVDLVRLPDAAACRGSMPYRGIGW